MGVQCEYSVLMSVYKGDSPELLRSSMSSMFDQTVKPSDFVLVCDGELSPSLNRVIEEFENRESCLNVIRLASNRGLGKALEVGLQECKYELVARMDSDDISVSNRMMIQLAAFEATNADVIGGAIAEYCDNPKQPYAFRIVPDGGDKLFEFAKLRNPMNHVTVMFKRSEVIRCGGYKDMPYVEDYYLWVRMLANGATLINVPNILVYVHADENMYKRRAGFEIAKSQLKVAKEMRGLGLINNREYIRNVSVRVGGSLIPSFVRKAIYRKKFRKTR